ncbi:unnamed protein product [Acanthoscelides obtectus]|uniref:Centrosomal protein of 104 kDa n=1 Tax=Acanthoscelides obtectus TaxID=200917 RepID=A0A9P0K709_ACAOB|nr:unnamed protein product [Acanthoscelides obtectus]CAK1658687.1 Centrosomal protein of 104 kDa [Acanthoscelides obtectus]
MPKKIRFTVVYVTSEESKYKSTELNIHAPIVKGWQSVKDCEYPQEIILQLEKRCILSKVQLLAHQFLIPSKVELFVNNEDTNTVEDVANLCWDYLGYITLSTNESTGFKSRELKSANVPKTEVTYVKINLHNNHVNVHNVFKQVSIIAVNILGMDIETRRSSVSEESEASKLNDIMNSPEYFSPYDDLAFIMYVDSDIAKIIRDMEIKKHLAVINERFEYARKLKNAMSKLRTAGEKLVKYELEKRHAIELEDYERASFKKTQMEQFRNEVYEEVCLEQLMEQHGVCPKNDESSIDDIDSNNQNKNLLSPVLSKNPSDSRRVSSPNQTSPAHLPRHHSPKTGSPSTGSPTNIQTSRSGSFRRRNKSVGAIVKSTYEMYEEKPLPALRHSQTNEFLRECQLEPEYKVTSKLTEREKKQAALPILVFGNDLVEKFYSKHYCDKEDGLNRLKDELLAYDSSKMHAPNKTARAAIFLLHRSLRDKVFSVYSLANEVIRLFFVQFVPGRVSSAEVARSVDKLLPELLTKSGDTSQRINQMAVHTILTMADCKSVSGLTCRTLSEFGSSGLHHPAEAVRKVSERILVLVYKVNSRLVRKQLPPDDDITRRNLLYRQLFHEFDKIDLLRKKEILEKNKLLQQTQIANDCLSPEPNFGDINKCMSTSMRSVVNDVITNHQKYYQLSKSVSGSNMHTNGTNANGSPGSASGISSPSNNSNNSQKEEDEKQCIFCNQLESVILSSNNSMNSHYWRSCLMLVRCKECSQVVEVASLIEHLLMECEHRESYTQCSRCSEAVKLDEFQGHQEQCIELSENCNKCPLCHGNIECEEQCWKTHLMGENPCPKNTRFKMYQQKQVKIQI